jgi:enediyne biosynthesis protein E3
MYRFFKYYFYGKHHFFKKRFLNILLHFFSGALFALLIPHAGLLRLFIQKLTSSFYRGFTDEGTGIGFGIRANLFKHKGSYFENSIIKLTSRSIYQYYVGLGWWLHFRYKYNVKKYDEWTKELNSKYALILFDGVGFKIGLFKFYQNKKCLHLLENFTEPQQRVCYQGFGRSLWFLSKFDCHTAISHLDQLGKEHPFRKDILSGMGLAMAYSKFDDLSLGFSVLSTLPQKDKSSFAQGLAFGLEARKKQYPELWKETLEKLPREIKIQVNDLIQIVYQVEEELDAICNSHDYYLLWIDKIRNNLEGDNANL